MLRTQKAKLHGQTTECILVEAKKEVCYGGYGTNVYKSSEACASLSNHLFQGEPEFEVTEYCCEGLDNPGPAFEVKHSVSSCIWRKPVGF